MDEETRMMRDSLLICALFWAAMLSLIFLSACTPAVEHQVTVPQADILMDRIAELKPPVTCRKLELPPVPADVKLDISGDKIAANAGGEQLLRGYVACRSLYQDAQRSTTSTATP